VKVFAIRKQLERANGQTSQKTALVNECALFLRPDQRRSDLSRELKSFEVLIVNRKLIFSFDWARQAVTRGAEAKINLPEVA
jgi:hypothetical protein